MYAGVTAVSHPRVVVVDRVATTFMWAAAIVLAVALTTVVVYTFVQGLGGPHPRELLPPPTCPGSARATT